MRVEERQKLLDRLVDLNGGNRVLATAYANAPDDELFAVVERVETTVAARDRAGGRLAHMWSDPDSAVLVESGSKAAAE